MFLPVGEQTSNLQVPNPFGHDAGRGAMEGIGEDEWVVSKDKVSLFIDFVFATQQGQLERH